VTYTLTSFSQNLLSEEKKDYGKLVSVGTIIYFFAMLLTGPVPYILPNNLYIMIGGLLL